MRINSCTDKQEKLYLHTGRQPGYRSCGRHCWKAVVGLQLVVGVGKQPQGGSGYMGEADCSTQGEAGRQLLEGMCQLTTVRPAGNNVCSVLIQGSRKYLCCCQHSIRLKFVTLMRSQAASGWLGRLFFLKCFMSSLDSRNPDLCPYCAGQIPGGLH